MNDSRTRSGALESGLDVLEALASSSTGLGVSDLAAALSMDKGNAHRLLRVLMQRGYVQQSELTKRYRPSAKLVSVAGSVLRRLDLRAASEDACDELLEQTGESVHVSQMTTGGPVYVLQRKAPFRVSVDTEVGARPPMHATATGKAVLAYVPEADRESWLTLPLERFTIRTITSMDELNRDLTTVAAQGYALDDEEYNPGVRCIAAPVFGIDGTVVGCIGVSSPIHRMGLERIPVAAEQLLAAARSVTERLGGPLERHDTINLAEPEGSTAAR
ncbi:IclR family transcriptional regulator [Leucobacter luti]|uniref:IclR family transcriptional regulator n=1 Tax=Leucobacter luti TaxID=340320 RepID=A0A4Q7U4D1_9MICO|nr:IclR family transcriptional regulator [Leucobacter luti]MBL3700780.1 IclR family transcriptional regulator [Leucobacter luti]RZT68383.1 IclR family transcriptional regulator [Leucobacter luti]